MDWLGFVASLVKSLAWPTVVVFAMFVFKTQLAALAADLLSRLTHAEVAGAKLDFTAKANHAKSEVAASLGKEIERRKAQQLTGTTPRVPEAEPVEVPADEEPTYAVLTAWERVGGIVRDLGGTASSREGWSLPRTRSTTTIVRELYKRDVVDGAYVNAIQSLAELRNAAAHSALRLDRDAAVAYVSAANELIRATEAILKFRYDPASLPSSVA